MGEAAEFLPAYQVALIVVDLVTVVLLYGEFRAGGAAALLVLATGYLFEVGIIIMHTLSFPGLFAARGVIGGGAQTTGWLWFFWHAGFVAAIWAYALMTRHSAGPRIEQTGPATAVAGLAVVLALASILLTVTAGHDWLPPLVSGGGYTNTLNYGLGPAICLAALGAAALVWRNRERSVIDLWLLVVLVTWACDVALSAVLDESRFDLGWYSGRAFGLLASTTLLIVLLLEGHAGQRRLIEARERLAQRQHLESLGQLTGGVAHDFNNVLAVLSGSLESIERHRASPDQVTRWAEIARAGVTRGTAISQQLLTFAGRQAVRTEMLDIDRVLAEFEPLVRQALPVGIDLALQLGAAPATAQADRGDLEAAILNLAVNARHAMKDRGRLMIQSDRVTVRTGEVAGLSAGAYVAIRVTDNGEGMTPEVAAKAVTPFFTTKPRGQGTGFGLSQVYGFARGCGGDIEIRTQRGRGTTIGIYLPINPLSGPAARP